MEAADESGAACLVGVGPCSRVILPGLSDYLECPRNVPQNVLRNVLWTF